jgi:hypothetical protein
VLIYVSGPIAAAALLLGKDPANCKLGSKADVLHPPEILLHFNNLLNPLLRHKDS